MILPFPEIAFIQGVGGPELIMIFLVVLLLFGGQKLPELARGMGKAAREFKKASASVEQEVKNALEEPVSIARAALSDKPRSKPVPPVEYPAAAPLLPPENTAPPESKQDAS